MRCRLTLVVVAASVGGYPVLALAQAPVNINAKGAGVAGTGFGGAVGITRQQVPLVTGKGRFGAGTGGLELGVGNVTGGINDSPRAGTGGIGDATSWGIATGGILGSGRGQSAGTGGGGDQSAFGRNTGGVNGSQIGAGTGGIGDLNNLGADTGGINEHNAPRFQTVQ